MRWNRSSLPRSLATQLRWVSGLASALMLIVVVALLVYCSTSPNSSLDSSSLRNPTPEVEFDVSEPSSTVTVEATTTTAVEAVVETVPSTLAPRSALRTTTTVEAEEERGGLEYGEWAIPRYIVGCETGWTFSWDSYNSSSGAAGPYQLMPEHFGDDARNHSHQEQHNMATRLWDGGRGASNWQACL